MKIIVLAALLTVAAAQPVLAQEAAAPASGDAARGATLYKQRCAACHALPPAKSTLGPSLVGVAGRKAASGADFKYSAALTASGLTWDKATLDSFLAAPMKAVKGTSMMIAVPAPADRADLIAYLSGL
jgi:cytochrome c2